MMERPRLTTDEYRDWLTERRERVARLTREGKSCTQIAAILGVSDRTVLRDRQVIGIANPRVPRLTAEELARAAELFAEGCSCAEVARTIGRSPRNLRRLFPESVWSRTEAGRFAAFHHHYGLRGML